MTGSRRRRVFGVTLAATALALVGVAAAAPSTFAAGPSISISKNVLKAGDTITVTGTGFPTDSAQWATIYVSICADPPSATNCNTKLGQFTAFDTYDSSGGFSIPFTLVATSFNSGDGPINCAVTSCVVGTTNGTNPKDHSYNATAPFTVAGSTPPTSTPTPTTTSPSATPTSSPNPTSTGTPTGSPSTSPTGTSSPSPNPTSTAAPGAPTITYTPSVVADGMTITVSGNAGTKKLPAGGYPDLYVAVCESEPSATNCDQSLEGVGTSKAHILQVTPNPSTGAWGPEKFFVRQVIKTGDSPTGFDCKKAGTCVIGTTNSFNPKDRTYNTTKLLSFSAAAAPTLPPTVPPSDGTLTTSASTVKAGGSVTVSGSGYAPNSLVTIGVYSTPTKLTVASTDASGAFSATTTLPKSLSGAHTLAAVGTDPSGQSRSMTVGLTITAAGSGGDGDGGDGNDGNGNGNNGGNGADGSLAATGGSSFTPLVVGAASGLGLLGLLLLTLGTGRSRTES